MRLIIVFWIYIHSQNYATCINDYSGVDIGYSCKYDAECNTGNGGEYSKCNNDLNMCICTINHLGEDKCMHDSDQYDGICRRQTLYEDPGFCTSECSPKGTIQWRESQDWYGEFVEPFASIVPDKKTSVCYDPTRAFNSVPTGFEIRLSTIPNAGYGVFTNIYVEQNTMFGPFRGTFDSDPETGEDSGYSWMIKPLEGEGRNDTVWIDAKDIALSNWLRYLNTPTTTAMENIMALQYKGEIFYQAFKSIKPGTEMLVWYGEAYGEYLGIEEFDGPRSYFAKHGYVGGFGNTDNEGLPCIHDEHTVCAHNECFCIPRTHIRAGMCIPDENLGGICVGSDGETCKFDKNAECQRGVCVCKNNSSPAKGECILDETLGGRCARKNGQNCLLDNNTECVHGLCRCRYGTTGIGGKFVTDETYQGRCSGEDGEACDLDQNAECWDGTCLCKKNASEIRGKCELDGALGGKCDSKDGLSCTVDDLAICDKGICVCKKGASNVDGLCTSDGSLSGICLQGNCAGQGVVCDTSSNKCVCQSHHLPDAGKCVQK